MKFKYGSVFYLVGTKERWIMVDSTLGGDFILIPYRLRNSTLKYHISNQHLIKKENFDLDFAYCGETNV